MRYSTVNDTITYIFFFSLEKKEKKREEKVAGKRLAAKEVLLGLRLVRYVRRTSWSLFSVLTDLPM